MKHRPCPFCGEDIRLRLRTLEEGEDQAVVCVVCERCHAVGPSVKVSNHSWKQRKREKAFSWWDNQVEGG